MKSHLFLRPAAALFGLAIVVSLSAQMPAPPAAPKLKEEMRQPWQRSNERFIRGPWQVLGELPLGPAPDAFAADPFAGQGGEATLKPSAAAVEPAAGTELKWRSTTAWGDAVDLSDGKGVKRNLVAYAATTIKRDTAGKARLSLGSDESLRAWVNGKLAVDRAGARPLTFDEDQIEVDLNAGDNLLLVKVEQRTGEWNFAARVLETGAIPSRAQEIAPSFVLEGETLVVRTDLNAQHAGEDKVTVSVHGPGGRRLADQQVAPRGEALRFDTAKWPDGPYEIRCATTKADGLRTATHLGAYKGDAIAAAREVVAAAAKADTNTPTGQTIKMLGDMVLDRLGNEGLAITGNPWWLIHSPLMEYAELQLEAADNNRARLRPHGFYRLAWRDEVDGSPQFACVYLPIGYDPAKQYPLVLKLHGFNPANPVYVRWWSADVRHSFPDAEYGNHEGVIYIEPHGRNNTQYLGLGDADVVRVVALAKQRFSVDEDRVYLCGDSMGGWGTWNVGTRHPDLFAALGPIYGGVDYHSFLPEAALAGLTPLAKFMFEKSSTWAQADGLLNVPVLVHHGDVDQAVNVDWSRYGVRLLQRWGYNVRYFEMPGYAHEDLGIFPDLITWFLQQRRDPAPRHVRLRSAELQNASAYWVAVKQFERPDAFMVVDAEVIGGNTVRVDTQNVRAISLTPGPGLVDPAKPVKIVWNGTATEHTSTHGGIELGAPVAAHAKNARIAGPLGEILNTPFIIVTGTASPDPEMNALLQLKAQALFDFWQDWQKQPPRMVKDSELSDGDAARFSLVLIGGADANLVSRRLADKLPVKVTPDRIEIDGHAYPATDARVQLVRPNPLNPERYIVLTAATSVNGLRHWAPRRLQGQQFDFIIADNLVSPTGPSNDPSELWIAGGWFDRDWGWDDALVHTGAPEVRGKALRLGAPLEAAALEAYTGRYEIAPGVVATLKRVERRLIAEAPNNPTVEFTPIGTDRFFSSEGGDMLVTFERDAAGKITGFKGRAGQEFIGKRLD